MRADMNTQTNSIERSQLSHGENAMFSMKNTQRIIAFLGFITALLSGCAQDLGTVDRTQPNALQKSLFEGEWYYRQTVVDAPATSAYSFIGDQFQMVRGVFDIQESSLYMYRTYEFAQDAETVSFRSDKDIPYCVDLGNATPTAMDMEWCNKDKTPSKATKKVVRFNTKRYEKESRLFAKSHRFI